MFEGKLPAPDLVVAAARRLTSESKHLQQIQGVKQNGPSATAGYQGVQNRGMGGWSRPETGCIKVNCDASWVCATGRGGIGIIARDHDGQVVG